MRYIEAVRAQAKNLRVSRESVAGRLAELDLAPWRGRRLALTGMGASWNAIVSVLPAYWSAGLPASGWLSPELEAAGPAAGAEAVVAVSQTGESAETHSALRAAGCPRLVVTDAEGSPVARLADATLPLALLEDSEVRTLGYTGTVQALLLLGDALADALGDALAGRGGPADQNPLAGEVERLADEVERLLPEAERLAERLLPRLRGVACFDLVGSGAAAGTAAQGALLLREVAKLPASGYQTYQYLHGPIEAAGAGRALIVIGGAREARLAGQLAETGATVLLISASDAAQGPEVFRLPGAGLPGDLVQAVLAVLPLQAIAGRLAADLGLPDGEFRYHQDDTKLR